MGPLDLESFVTKRIPFSYRGHRLSMSLSQSLFSSFEVDRGSGLLLKSIAGSLRRALPAEPAVLDVGSGTGVLGICVALDIPGARVWFQDRDALAVAFSGLNCRGSGVDPAHLQGELALEGLGEASFDLIVCNVPAKAGEPVHAEMLRRMAGRLKPDGVACMVVVAPLADRIRGQLLGLGLQAEEVERAAGHSVFHARVPPGAASVPGDPADPLAAYLRCRAEFRHGDTRYEIAAAFDLPEFDSLSHRTALALEMLDEHPPRDCLRRPILVWNPGQGHVPAFLAARERAGAPAAPLGPLTLGSRDLLALRVAARNTRHGQLRCVHAWDPASCGGPFGCMVLFPDDDPHVRWDAYLPALILARLEPDGLAVISADSTFVSRLLRHIPGLVLLRSRKKAGARSILLRRGQAARS